MMNDLVPIIPSAQAAMALRALEVWPRAALPATIDGRPRTIIITRQQAGQLEVEALVACLVFMAATHLPVLALCGGGASATFKAHPNHHKRRFQVTEEELDTELVDLRLSRPREHMIAVFDPNRNAAAVAITSMLMDFDAPVDLIYVAAPTETHSPFIEYCRANGIHPVTAEQNSAFSEKRADRLYFPGIPRQLSTSFQEGEHAFSEILAQGSPAVIASYLKATKDFERALKAILHG